MGLFDGLRMSTGLGLEPAEAYKRAYEKGVLLGATHYATAADMFQEAAQKLQTVSPPMAYRAMANAHIYRFLGKRDLQAGSLAVQTLAQVPLVEIPGTADEVMEGPKLGAEINARVLEEYARHASTSGGSALSDAYRRAAQAWVPLLEWRPVTYELVSEDAFTEDGMARFFLNSGHAVMNDALLHSAVDPDVAAEYFALAAQAYGRCGATDLRARARDKLRSARHERPCWFCGRRVRGFGDNLRVLSAGAAEYFVRAARADRERGESLEAKTGGVYACAVCASAVDRIAEVRADAVRTEMNAHVNVLMSAVATLEARVRVLEARRFT